MQTTNAAGILHGFCIYEKKTDCYIVSHSLSEPLRLGRFRMHLVCMYNLYMHIVCYPVFLEYRFLTGPNQ